MNAYENRKFYETEDGVMPRRNNVRPIASGKRRRRKRMTPAQKFVRESMPVIVLTALPLVGLLAGILLTSAVMGYRSSYLTRDYGRELKYVTYTVQSGDTMWSIAADMSALNPEFPDMRQYLSMLQRCNKNYGDVLKQGTTILIPYYQSPTGRDFLSIYEKYGIDMVTEPDTGSGIKVQQIGR